MGVVNKMYATLDSLIKRYGREEITQLACGEDRELDVAKAEEALFDASDTINSYLGGRYTLPLSQVPAVLERHCCYIARYFLERNRATDQARKDYEDSIRFWKKWQREPSHWVSLKTAKPSKARMWLSLSRQARCGQGENREGLFDECDCRNL